MATILSNPCRSAIVERGCDVYMPDNELKCPELEDLLHYRVQRLASKMSLITSREVLRGSGVHVGEWRLICLLAKSGSLKHSDISRTLALDPGRTSRLLQATERKGLTIRKTDPSDGRSSIFYPTSRAIDVFDRLWPQACKIADDFHGTFSKQELEQLNQYLDRAIGLANSKTAN